jgi:hypothetical protein
VRNRGCPHEPQKRWPAVSSCPQLAQLCVSVKTASQQDYARTQRGKPDAELAVVTGTSHGLLHEKPALCNKIIVDFLVNDPVPTIAPVRRAT